MMREKITITYGVFGPFTVPRVATFDPKALKAFWDEEVDKSEPGLCGACGCYVISVHEKVWYVGLAQRQDFARECSTADKLLKLARAIHAGKGDAYMHLVALTTPGGKFAKPSRSHKHIDKLETMLITLALQQNKHLINRSKTKFFRSATVPGILNSPRSQEKKKSVRSLTELLGARLTGIVKRRVGEEKTLEKIDGPENAQELTATPTPIDDSTAPPAKSESVSYGSKVTMTNIKELLTTRKEGYSVEELADKLGKKLSTIRTNLLYMPTANSKIGYVNVVKNDTDGKYYLKK